MRINKNSKLIKFKNLRKGSQQHSMTAASSAHHSLAKIDVFRQGQNSVANFENEYGMSNANGS